MNAGESQPLSPAESRARLLAYMAAVDLTDAHEDCVTLSDVAHRFDGQELRHSDVRNVIAELETANAEIRRLKYALLDSTHAPRVARTVAELNELPHRAIGVDNRGYAVTVTQSAGEYARVNTGTSTVRGGLWFNRGLGPIMILHIPEVTR